MKRFTTAFRFIGKIKHLQSLQQNIYGNLFFIKILGKFSNSNEEISPCLKERLHSDQML